MNGDDYTIAAPWTWRDRLRAALFPRRHCPLPSAPAEFQDCISCHVTAEVSLLDRFRVMASGRVHVEVKIVTEHTPGKQIAGSVFTALPPKWMDQ